MIASASPTIPPNEIPRVCLEPAELGQGLAYVRREPVLWRAAVWSGTANFFVIMVETLGPVFLDD